MKADRDGWRRYISEAFDVQVECPWERYPSYMVFRHRGNRKWFALIMTVPKGKLGVQQDGALDILNVKCDPLTIGSFRAEPGIFPAYHMSKTSWISVALDGSVRPELITTLLDMSFALTAPKVKRGGAQTRK